MQCCAHLKGNRFGFGLRVEFVYRLKSFTVVFIHFKVERQFRNWITTQFAKHFRARAWTLLLLSRFSCDVADG